jgi:hypothetical protein
MPKFYGSHQKLLFEVVRISTGPVLELGAGEFSTVQLHNMLKGRKLVTYDNNIEWLNKYMYLKDESHNLISGDVNEFYDNDNEKWGLVFIDNGTWEARVDAICKYKDIADYIVIHDSDIMRDWKLVENLLTRKLEPITWDTIFKYWKEFHLIDYVELSPYTLVGSNKFDVTGIIIEGMI